MNIGKHLVIVDLDSFSFKSGLLFILLLSACLSLSSVVNSFEQTYGLSDFNFGTAGDWGCNSNTDATVNNIVEKNPEVVFGLGDYSYLSTGTCWFDKIAPIDSITKISIGNHEDDESEGFSDYMNHFVLSHTYYSYKHQNVHVLVMDTDRNSFLSGSSQYDFIANDLQAASQDPNVDWIIVYLHKPMYTSPVACCTPLSSLRDLYHPLFDQYGVDLVLQGHVHNYQRTFPLSYNPSSPPNPTVTNLNANNYTNPVGPVFAIVGTGGVNFHGLSGKASYVSSQQDDFFGQLDIRITNDGSRLEGRFYRNGNNAILDSFSITNSDSLPGANDQAAAVIKNTPTPLTLTATDPNNDPLTYTIVTPPENGTLSGTAPNLTYTPNVDYIGPDSFTFKANDGTLDSNIAVVSINVQELAQGGYNYAPSLVLTGSTHHDTPSSSALQLSHFSVAAWFKTSTNFGSDAFIVNKGGIGSDSAGNNMNYGIWMTSSGRIQAGFEAVGGANHFVTSFGVYDDNRWHYAMVTYDGSTVIMYIDGVQIDTKSTSGASPETTGTKPVRVGANSRVTPPTNFFTGEVDEVRVWKTALTAQQAADAFAGISFNTAEQVLHLAFGGSGGGGEYNYAPSLALTGSNYHDEPSSSALQLSQFSAAAWFKTSTNFGSNAFIVNKGGIGSDSAGNNMNYGIWMTSSERIVAGFEAVGGADHFVTSTDTYNDGQWHYAVVTYDGSTVILYIDGVQIDTKSTSGASPETTGTKPVRVGANSRVTPPTNFFTGEVDEVRVWNNDLTATQVAQAFGGSITTTSQVIYLPFGGSAGGYNYAPALVLTGSNLHDEPDSPLLRLSKFSVATWFKTVTNFATNGFIVNKGGSGSDSAGQNQNYGIWMTSSERIVAGFESVGGADHFVTSTDTYNDGQWHYAVVTYDGSTVIMYIDGVQIDTKSTSGASPETTGTKPVRVGANSRVTPSNSFFTGEIDEVRIWNTALNPMEVSNAFAGTFKPGHVLHLDFSSAAMTGGYNYDPSLSLSGPGS